MAGQSKARLMAAGMLVLTVLGASGCSKVKGYQGYVVDQTLVTAIQPGVDNRASVERTLGRPSFMGQFDQNDWYYVSRQTRQYAFANPRASDATILRVHFDAAGNVAAVQQAGVDQVVSINPDNNKTPTLGRDRSFFEELFGNIGQVGSVGEGGGTTDNPN